MRLLIYGDIGGSGGYVRYCKGLLSNISIPEDMEVWFICSLRFYDQLKPLDPRVHVITHRWMDSSNRLYRYLWHLWVYPRIIRKINANAEFYPLGQLRLFMRKAKTISTCHNLLLFDNNELNRIANKEQLSFLRSYRKRQSKSFQKSNAVIFLSDYSANMVCREVGGIQQKTVIGHGLDSIFLQPNRRTYTFGKRIHLLYVSPVYRYKNQFEVVNALELLRQSTGLDLHLTIIGGGDEKCTEKLLDIIETSSARESIQFTGAMAYEGLLKEYETADIFIFASSCETFGITILEAMASRLPIACSNRTGLSDILLDAGVYFDPYDPLNIAAAIQKLLEDENLRMDLAEKAYHYALAYTWQRCANETFNFIKKI